ncbi:MAG: DUF1997 domain-containing protein [Cyanobacteria bacterium]|nr:DUF1997 domain-containing protein [Cyanobacteriota bacterium]
MAAPPIASFFASQVVHLPVSSSVATARAYLRKPHRVVDAVTGTSQVEDLGGDRVRLTMRPLTFLTLTFRPRVDMRVWTDELGTVRLRSLACELEGIDYLNHRFSLDLVGYLKAIAGENGTATLTGVADLGVKVEIPGPLRSLPRSMVLAAGNGLLRGVLATVEGRLRRDLLADYGRWMRAATLGQEASQPPSQMRRRGRKVS